MKSAVLALAVVFLSFVSSLPAHGQQTLGSVDGTVTDASGAIVRGVTVSIRNVATNLTVSLATRADGSFHADDLPIGTYEVIFTKEGFQKEVYSQILILGNRTTTVNTKLSPGAISSSVTVEATPLLNETDTTTGYSLGELQIDNIPLGTGSFTQLAVLSPGVSADLLNTSGSNAGFGNQAIWANGQRDTSNSFEISGVDANNIFNGKSTSQVTSARVAVNIGENGNGGSNPGGDIVTSTSVYGAIGQSLPTPPLEAIQEINVNSAMYDASQGANSGAHIEVTPKSGTNNFHGNAYEYYQTGAFDANEWFFNDNGVTRPALHRNVFGGTFGGPIKKDKLFFFGSYEGQRVADRLLDISYAAVPPDLTSELAPDRSAQEIANVTNMDFGTNIQASQITQQALDILQAKLPNGQYFIPSASPNALNLQTSESADTVVTGTGSLFTADQAMGNIDYNFGPKDRLAAKYFYQRNPNTTPFAQSTLEGFPQTLEAGSQLFSLDNTTILTPNLTWDQRFGFIRERAFATTSEFLSPGDVNMNLFGLTKFPSIAIGNADGAFDSLTIGPLNNFANAGIVQNNFEATSSLTWIHGRHSIMTGINWEHTQLNVINDNNQLAQISFADFPGFLLGTICGPANLSSCNGQSPSEFLNGESNRHYRTDQVGTYVQDDFKIRHNLTVDIGLRWDWDGPLTEANGLLTNFYPQNYSYDVASDTISNIGLVVAGNNPTFGTKGVSDSTLTGRQWGFAPRIGLVYSPGFLKNFVIRTGFGLYYDRGEFFTELSPPAGGGISGPFGVTVEEPFVIPIYSPTGATFANPFGTTAPPPPPTNLSAVSELIPNAGDLVNQTTPFCTANGLSGCSALFFGGYDPKNKLPYSENWTLDLQWQPINTVVMSLAYVGNHGVHGVIPLPFNQAQIATPQSPLLTGGPYEQDYSYGWQTYGVAAENVQTLVQGYSTGNAALRAPYIGYDPNSEFNEAVGTSNYNSLQFSVDKRFSHGLLVKGSYTYSHTLDEQSGLGLFFTGNNPNDLNSSYADSDYDRTHVFVVSYVYQLPTKANATGFVKQAANGWALHGITTLQSGQPYSVQDYSGSVGGIYWQAQDYITNPLVPIGGLGATSTNPVAQGTTGFNPHEPLLNPLAFGPPTPYAPGTNGVPPCDPSSGVCDNFETGYSTVNTRNVFRGPFQNRFDFGLSKDFAINERFKLRYDVNAFNIFNHPSFDIPNNNVEFAPDFENPPQYGPLGFGHTAQSFTPCDPTTGAFACPPVGHLGFLQHTIGSPRFIQMALHLDF
jgi:carboxypeptidase family protein